MAFWRDEFTQEHIDFIFEEIRGIRIIGSDGRISFQGGHYDGWIAVLVSALGLKVKSDALRHRIISGALSSSDLAADFTDKDFRDVANRLCRKYQTEDLRVYRIAFPIWNKPSFLQGTRKMGDVNLNFSPSPKTPLFKRIIREREVQRTDRIYKMKFTVERLKDLQQCSICLAHVRANSPADANEQASEELYEILGLVNLAIDGGKYSRSSSRVDGKLPVSDVLIGPHTTTHFENGKLTHDGFWHENWVGGSIRKTRSAEAMTAWEKRVQQLVEGISKSPWRGSCKSAAARYLKAFSNPNLEESFLEGWRLFENISGSRYTKIPDQLLRASNIFEANTEYLIIGKHLALRRNLLAHGHAITANDDETVVFQMLKFVVPFLERYILNNLNFQSEKEFWEFLDLPAQKDKRAAKRSEYERQLDLLAKAASFRDETDW